MKLNDNWTKVTPLSRAIAMSLMVLLPFGGFFAGQKYQTGKITKITDDVRKFDSIDVKVISRDNDLTIIDSGKEMPIVKLTETGRFGTYYKLITARNEMNNSNQTCEETVYLQKNNGALRKVYSGNGCEFIWAEPEFLDHPWEAFFINHTGDGGHIVLYDFNGEKIDFEDNQKIMDGWNVYRVETDGRSGDPPTFKLKLFLERELGSKFASIIVDLDNKKVVEGSFKKEVIVD